MPILGCCWTCHAQALALACIMQHKTADAHVRPLSASNAACDHHQRLAVQWLEGCAVAVVMQQHRFLTEWPGLAHAPYLHAPKTRHDL